MGDPHERTRTAGWLTSLGHRRVWWRGGALALLGAVSFCLVLVNAGAQNQAAGTGISFVDRSPLRVSEEGSAEIQMFNGGRKAVRVRIVVTGADVAPRTAISLARERVRVGRTATARLSVRSLPSNRIAAGELVALSSDGSLARRPIELRPASYVPRDRVLFTAERKRAPSLVDNTPLTARPDTRLRAQSTAAGIELGRVGGDGESTGSVETSSNGVVVTGLSDPGEYRGSFGLEPDGTGQSVPVTVRISDAWWWTAAALIFGVLLAWLLEWRRGRRVPEVFRPLDDEAAALRRDGNGAILGTIGGRERPLPPLYAYPAPRIARVRAIAQLRAATPGSEAPIDLEPMRAFVDRYRSLIDEAKTTAAAVGRVVTPHDQPDEVGLNRALRRGLEETDDLESACLRLEQIQRLTAAVAELDGFYLELERSRNQPEKGRRAVQQDIENTPSLRAALSAAQQRAHELKRDHDFPVTHCFLEGLNATEQQANSPLTGQAKVEPISAPWMPDRWDLALRLAVGLVAAAVALLLFRELDNTFGSAPDYFAAVLIGFSVQWIANRSFWRRRLLESAALESSLSPPSPMLRAPSGTSAGVDTAVDG